MITCCCRVLHGRGPRLVEHLRRGEWRCAGAAYPASYTHGGRNAYRQVNPNSTAYRNRDAGGDSHGHSPGDTLTHTNGWPVSYPPGRVDLLWAGKR